MKLIEDFNSNNSCKKCIYNKLTVSVEEQKNVNYVKTESASFIRNYPACS